MLLETRRGTAPPIGEGGDVMRAVAEEAFLAEGRDIPAPAGLSFWQVHAVEQVEALMQAAGAIADFIGEIGDERGGAGKGSEGMQMRLDNAALPARRRAMGELREQIGGNDVAEAGDIREEIERSGEVAPDELDVGMAGGTTLRRKQMRPIDEQHAGESVGQDVERDVEEGAGAEHGERAAPGCGGRVGDEAPCRREMWLPGASLALAARPEAERGRNMGAKAGGRGRQGQREEDGFNNQERESGDG